MALGLLVDGNTGSPTQVDNWAQVLDNTVLNIVSSSYNSMNGSAEQALFDYTVDITVQGQSPGPGWTYDHTSDTFTMPTEASPDWVSVVTNDWSMIISDIQQIITDSGAGGGDLNLSGLAESYNDAVTIDNAGSLDALTLGVLLAIYQYIVNENSIQP